MRGWLMLLGGLVIWAAHFFAVYVAASLFPGTVLARWIVAIITVAGLVLLGLVALPAARRLRHRKEDRDLHEWTDGLLLLGAALTAVAITYQGLPALIS